MWTRWSGHAAPTVVSSGAVARADELEHPRRRVDDEHFGRSLDTAPRSAGRTSRRSAARSSSSSPAAGRAAEPGVARRPRVDEVGGAVDDLERAPVGLLGGVAPYDEPVLGEHDELQAGSRRTASPTWRASVKPGRM